MEEFLKDVGSDKAFFFVNGAKARNLYELAQGINALSNDSFRHHCNLDHDDFANWIGGAIGDIILSQRLRFLKDKDKYLKAINQRIKALERQAHSRAINQQFSDQMRSTFKNYAHIWLIIVVMVMTAIFTAMIYYQYHSLQTIQTLDEKINYLESRNTCFNNYFNDQILSTKEAFASYNFSVDNYCVLNYSTTIKVPDRILEDRPAYISTDDIVLTDSGAVINAEELQIAVFANTSSMLPVLNHNTRALEVYPKVDELHIGDIISYRDNNDIIIHRIIDIGHDELGSYYITKGDNNNVVDQKKVRFDDINGKVVALIY